MEFVVAIEPGTKEQAFGVVVPDLPGCFSAGDSFEEALRNAQEAIVLHLEELGAQGIEAVVPKRLEEHVSDPDFDGWLWGFVDIDDRLLGDRAERINITVPARKLVIIDKAAARAGKARSEYLVEGAVARAMHDLQERDDRNFTKVEVYEPRRDHEMARDAERAVSRQSIRGKEGTRIATKQFPKGLDDRQRDQDGQIRKKRGDTRVETLRKEYGDSFASNYRSDAKLKTVLKGEGVETLDQLLKKKR